MILYYITGIALFAVIIMSLCASSEVHSTFNKYAKTPNHSNKTGSEIALIMLSQAGITDVKIRKIKGHLTDNYNPQTKVLSLSESTYDSSSVSAIGVAAHEVGHAIQHHQNYKPVVLRSKIVPIVNIGSRLSIPMLIIGILLTALSIYSNVGDFFIIFSIVLYSLSTLFALVTLKVERDASARALANLESSGILDSTETPHAKKVLKAAEKTYLASLLVSLIYLIRFIII